MEEVIDAMETESQLRDDMLRLIFTCCHPALSREAQVALALRTLARLEVDAIARAFLVPEATMAKRLVRARSKIATAHIPYAIPSDAELPDRLAAVLAVVYLIATEAHAPTGGNAVARVDLEAEAVRLARLLVELMPDEPEVLSLLALLLFTSARTPARSDAEGHVVTLADQDRGRWNREAIAEGSRWLHRAVDWSGGKAGPYQLQAHLAAAHSTATSWSETNWDRIIELYDLLGSAGANPVVALNRAVAVTERDGPEHGLAAAGGHRRAGTFPSLARRSGRQSPTAWPDGRGCRRAGNRRLAGAHRGRTTSASVPSPRREARARLTDSRAAGVLYWFRRSSSHQTQIPISEITLERRSR